MKTVEHYMHESRRSVTCLAYASPAPACPGVWSNRTDGRQESRQITLRLAATGDAVSGEIALSDDEHHAYDLDQLHMRGKDLSFTFEIDGRRNQSLEIQARLDGEEMHITLSGFEDTYRQYGLGRQREGFSRQ